MTKYSTIIVGGGASGLVAAISAKRKCGSVVICDRMPQLGRKILASGNGRCNLLNENLDRAFYNQTAQNLVGSIFNKFGKASMLSFFKGLGLEVYSEDGRIFPRTNQSSSVLKVLEIELERLAIPVELNFEVSRVSHSDNGFVVTSKHGKALQSEKLIIAGGGRSYPAFGSDGSCYKLAESFCHRIIKPVPSAVPLVVKDRLCHLLQGQKIDAVARVMIKGKCLRESPGDLLFTKYGLSGTAILDVSECASTALNRHNERDVSILVDMVPYMNKEALGAEIKRRTSSGWKTPELFTGILPNKFAIALKDMLKKWDAETTANTLKNWTFKVIETRGWNEADFTSGGVDIKDIKESTLESKFTKGLYFAGEVLDVCGARGGYNLAWAWASGFVAGLTE